MLSVNPYESPAIPAELLEPEWPATGVYRDGAYLVMHHEATLPPICIKTGKPAEVEQTIELVGGLPNDRSVREAGRKLLGDKVYRIQAPLSRRAVDRARWMHRAFLVAAVISVSALIAAAWFDRELHACGLADWVGIWLLAGFIGSIAWLGETRRRLKLECVAQGYFWISKAPPCYLRQLPPWPVPRPPWWQRALFGPPGLTCSPGRRQKSEGRSQKAEIRSWKLEGRG